MTLSTILAAFDRYPSVSTDTRKIKPNDLFFALKGENFNGNRFAGKALEAGASYAIVDEAEFVPAGDDRYILVEDVLTSLQNLATEVRRRYSIPFIGITGTNGKTTTKELTHAVLSSEKRVHATKGNLNNHIGVPLTLLSIPSDTEIAIIEMGANKLGDIAELAAIAEPDYGMITNIGYAHLERFGDIDGVTQTKGELFDFLRSANGCGWINEGDPRVLFRSKGLNCRYTYGGEDSNYRVISQKQTGHGMEVEISMKGNVESFTSQLVGPHNAENILASVIIGDTMGISLANMKKALAEYKPRMNRSQMVSGDKFDVLLDAYNANPSSMAATIRSVAERNEQSVGLILGDMFELGPEGPRFHQELVELVAELLPNAHVVGVGELMTQAVEKHCQQSHSTYAKVEDAFDSIQKEMEGRSFILIKGSRGVALEKILPALGIEV